LAVCTPRDWYFPSGTSTFLSLFLRTLGPAAGWSAAALVQALLSGAEVALLFVATRRFFGGRIGWIAALLLAGHYLAIDYAGYFLSETLLGVSLLAAAAVFVPEKPLRSFGAGLFLGIATWAKAQAFHSNGSGLRFALSRSHRTGHSYTS
jgi:hypothetical protein